MSPKDVSSAVVKQIVSQSGGQVIIPSSINFISLLRGFPSWLQERVRDQDSLELVKLRELQMELSEHATNSSSTKMQ